MKTWLLLRMRRPSIRWSANDLWLSVQGKQWRPVAKEKWCFLWSLYCVKCSSFHSSPLFRVFRAPVCSTLQMDTAADFEERRLIRAALRDLLKKKRGHVSRLLPRGSSMTLSFKKLCSFVAVLGPFGDSFLLFSQTSASSSEAPGSRT